MNSKEALTKQCKAKPSLMQTCPPSKQSLHIPFVLYVHLAQRAHITKTMLGAAGVALQIPQLRQLAQMADYTSETV